MKGSARPHRNLWHLERRTLVHLVSDLKNPIEESVNGLFVAGAEEDCVSGIEWVEASRGREQRHRQEKKGKVNEVGYCRLYKLRSPCIIVWESWILPVDGVEQG